MKFFRLILFLRILFAAILPVLLADCVKQQPQQTEAGGETRTQEEYSNDPAWPLLALLRIGSNPLWFELGPEGPEHIESPAFASLEPYTPWPHARYITGMQLWEGFIVMAVNTEGFLVLDDRTASDKNQEVYLYRISSGGFWQPYTTESFFVWDNKPAVLLYRNNFFSNSAASSLENQIYFLDKMSSVPLTGRIPAIDAGVENLSSEYPWEAEILRQGHDGGWYFRVREKGREEARTVFFSTEDLSKDGRRISEGEWRNSNRPQVLGRPDPGNIFADYFDALSAILRQADRGSAAFTLSPEFEGQRFFAAENANPGNWERLDPLYAYFREGIALAISNDGGGFFSTGTEVLPFSLPRLPEGFVYTGIALLGNAIAASWEEQDLPAVGATGFMLMNFAFN